VCDPAVGAGAFLLAAARALHGAGLDAATIAGSCLWGADTDPGAVAATVGAVGAWAEHEAGGRLTASTVDRLRAHVRVADALASRVWPDAPPGGFDLVVGNPPFQDQLSAATARTAEATAALRDRFGAVVSAYTDTAALFLVCAIDLAAPGGRVQLILPESSLAARDAAAVRRSVLDRARLDGLWVAGERVFDAAAVHVCAPRFTVPSDRRRHRAADAVDADPGLRSAGSRGAGFRGAGSRGARLADSRPPGGDGVADPEAAGAVADDATAPRRGSPAHGRGVQAGTGAGDGSPSTDDIGIADPLPRWRGRLVAAAPSLRGARPGEAGSWAPLVADLHGPPPSGLPADPADPVGRLGDLVTATAGFRDEYYGLVPHVGEAGAGDDVESAIRLVTSGLIDPGRCRWGDRPCRFARRRWHRPIVDLDALGATNPSLAAWAARLLVPKVVLATQTRVLEPAVDRVGSWWPSVPVVAVVPRVAADLDRVAAVLLAPAVSAWAFEQAAGSALSPGAIKLSARQVTRIPLPGDDRAWAAAAALVPALDHPDGDRPADSVLAEIGASMNRAYRADPSLLAWWTAHLGGRSPAGLAISANSG
jgi:hypothetical protein